MSAGSPGQLHIALDNDTKTADLPPARVAPPLAGRLNGILYVIPITDTSPP